MPVAVAPFALPCIMWMGDIGQSLKFASQGVPRRLTQWSQINTQPPDWQTGILPLSYPRLSRGFVGLALSNRTWLTVHLVRVWCVMHGTHNGVGKGRWRHAEWFSGTFLAQACYNQVIGCVRITSFLQTHLVAQAWPAQILGGPKKFREGKMFDFLASNSMLFGIPPLKAQNN